MRLDVKADSASVAIAAAQLVENVLATERSRSVTIGLSGGSTPTATYRLLANMDLDWNRVDFWLSDERWVPHDHPDSNGAMAVSTLTGKVDGRFHRPRFSDYLTPADSAAFYEADLRHLHRTHAPDLVLLGMGPDGHTASLFPNTAALDADPDRLYVANEAPMPGSWRMTATFQLLEQATQVVVLVCGQEKADTVAKVINGPDQLFPIQRLKEHPGEVIFLVDVAAAVRL